MQRVEVDTQMVVIEDCDKNINIEKFYSMITEGVTVEKKNKAEMYLPYDIAPKFGFSTNYSVRVTGNHGSRRLKIFEFAPFFSPQLTPFDYFGHNLFLDWDADEWNRFYNMMLFCCQSYLVNSVSYSENSETLLWKRLRNECGQDFYKWWKEFNSVLVIGVNYPSSELYSNFLDITEQDTKEVSKSKFAKKLVFCADIFNLKILEKHENNVRCKVFYAKS